MKLVEDLNILDEFELVPPKTAMKKIMQKLEADPGLSFLIEDPKSGKICGFIDSLLIKRLEEQGKKPKKGNAQSKMLTNLLFIINKTPLARLPQILPEKQPDAVIVNNLEGDFVGFLSSNDFQEAVALLGSSSSTKPIQESEDAENETNSSQVQEDAGDGSAIADDSDGSVDNSEKIDAVMQNMVGKMIQSCGMSIEEGVTSAKIVKNEVDSGNVLTDEQLEIKLSSEIDIDGGDIDKRCVIDALNELQSELVEINKNSTKEKSKPPKPSRGPPKSRSKMKVESHVQESEKTPEPDLEPETPSILVEEITDDDIEDSTDAFFNRVKGRSTGDIANIHGELADEAWGGAAEGTLQTGSIMHPLGAGQIANTEEEPEMTGTNVLMKTSAGDIQLQMYDDNSPETVANFMKLVDQGFYDGLHFHRVIEQFMLQGGCPNSRDPNNPTAGTGGPGWKIPCEQSALAMSHNRPGLMSMANAGPNTGGSQFFLTTVECPWLDGNHAIFGEVVSGMDVVMAIEGCQKGPGDRPAQPQQIISVSRM